MFRPILVLSLVLISLARVISEFGGNNLEYDESKVDLIDFRNARNSEIWVLELNDDGLDTLKLRGANGGDEEDFDFYTEPLIKNFRREHSSVVKKAPKPAKTEELDKKKITSKKSVYKKDIFKYLNKFALYSKTESDGYLSDSHENDDPSIALYFKGRFSSLTVKQGIRQWHYFMPPPSMLPAWFYEDLASNASEGVITVPDKVAEKFYPALFRLLQALLRYPL